MKFVTQLSILAISTLSFSQSTTATPIIAMDVEVREPAAMPVSEPVLEPEMVGELEKRLPKHHPHNSNNNKTDSSNDASSLANGGTFTLTGVAFLGSAMLLLA